MPASFEDMPVVIVGAGVAGLSAAWTFERAGLSDFVVLELEDVAGGTARSGDGPISPYPWGAHYVPAPPAHNRPLVALLDEVGAVAGRGTTGEILWAENVLCRDPEERLFYRGEWYEGLYPRAGASARDMAELRAFDVDMRSWAARRDRQGRRAFDLPRARSSDDDAFRSLDRLSMADYLASRGWSSPRLRWFVEYACRDDFGSTLDETSAWAGIHYYAARWADGSDGAARLLTWPEGNGRLVNHLAGVVGPRLRTGATVAKLLPRGDRVEATCLDASGDGVFGLCAEHVVFALPRFLAGRVIEPLRSRSSELGETPTYGSWMVANLTLRDRPASRGFPLAWDNVLYDSPSLGYVVATHQGGRDRGATVLTYYLPLVEADAAAARARLLKTPWEAWVETIMADLSPAHPGLRDLVERVDVYLWGHAMVRPRPGFLWSGALAAAAKPLGRIHFAHTDLSGMALFEEAQYWGIRAAEAIMRERGHAHRSWLA